MGSRHKGMNVMDVVYAKMTIVRHEAREPYSNTNGPYVVVRLVGTDGPDIYAFPDSLMTPRQAYLTARGVPRSPGPVVARVGGTVYARFRVRNGGALHEIEFADGNFNGTVFVAPGLLMTAEMVKRTVA